MGVVQVLAKVRSGSCDDREVKAGGARRRMKRQLDEADEDAKGAARKAFPPCLRRCVCVSLPAVTVFVLGMFFQLQVVDLRRELGAVRRNLSECGDETTRSLKKRSSVLHEGGVQAAHLQGTVPFQHIGKQGRIGPWAISTTDTGFVSLRRRNTEIQITRGGVYYLYAQVYYLTSQVHNSFQVLLYNGTEERKHHRILSTCSALGRNSIGEVSCFTAFAWSFRSGERLYLNQVEQNRIIHFSNGCSYFGVILLNRNAVFKPKT